MIHLPYKQFNDNRKQKFCVYDRMFKLFNSNVSLRDLFGQVVYLWSSIFTEPDINPFLQLRRSLSFVQRKKHFFSLKNV